MEQLISLALALLVIWWFGDLLLTTVLRVLGFVLALALAFYFQEGVAALAKQSDLVSSVVRASMLAWLAWLIGAAACIRLILRHARSADPGDVEAILLEIACAGLCFSVAVTILWAFPAWISGKAPAPCPSLYALALAGALLDLLFPCCLDLVARRLA